jgi:hypothetical protein
MESPLDRHLATTRRAHDERMRARSKKVRRRGREGQPFGISVGELEERASELSVDEAETLAGELSEATDAPSQDTSQFAITFKDLLSYGER